MRKTESFFGWTMPSRDAVRRAERALDSGEQSVRDEIGFLTIHDAYANRFFPGTSVQQTRLRYALLVPWIYRRLLERGIKRNLEQELAKEEVLLVERLNRLEGRGVIGGTIYPRPAKQPPSVIYWPALSVWNLMRQQDGGVPSRLTVHRALERENPSRTKLSAEFDTDEPYDPFWPLPDPPKQWNDSDTSLNFTLDPTERDFLAGKLRGVHKPGGIQISLLARLVEAKVAPTSIYSPRVARCADAEDRAALKRAESAAALGAVGRGIYAAILEEICELNDRRDSIGDVHRIHLFESVLPEFRESALQIDLDELQVDVPKMPESLVVVLKETYRWLEARRTELRPLRESYSASEHGRKLERARLPSTGLARERRNEWQPRETTLAKPLHYRWHVAQQFLRDLK